MNPGYIVIGFFAFIIVVVPLGFKIYDFTDTRRMAKGFEEYERRKEQKEELELAKAIVALYDAKDEKALRKTLKRLRSWT